MLADTNGAVKGIGRVEGRLDKLGGGFTKYGKLAAAGMAVAGAAVGLWAKNSLDSLARIERINAQTAQTIKSTGGAAGVSAKHVENLAGRLENLTATEAESTQEGANLLLTFKNIKNGVGKGNDIFDQTTRSLVDMSRAMGTEPKSAAIQLGKALNDPIKGISALSRVGITFSDDQKKVIEGFVKTGKVAEAQKIILKELNSEFGGSGKAFAKTAEGQKELLGHALGTLGETIFEPLLPWVTKATSKLTEFVNYLVANVGPAMAAVKEYTAPVVDAFRNLTSAGSGGQSALTPLMDFIQGRVIPGVMGILNAFKSLYAAIQPIIAQVVAGITSKWSEIQPQLASVWNSVKEIITSALSIIQSYIKVGTAVMTAVWNKFGSTIVTFISSSLSGVIKIVSGAFKVIAGLFKTVAALLKGDWSGAWDGIKQIASGALGILKGLIQTSLAVIKGMFSLAWTALKTIVSKAWDGIKSAVSTGISNVIGLIKSLPGKITGAIGDLGGLLKDAGKRVIQGLIDGIQSKIGEVEGMLKKVTDKIPDWKGPKDRDATLLTENGRIIMQSLIDGFEDMTPSVESFLGKLTDAVSSGFALGYEKRNTALTAAQTKEMKTLEKGHAAELAAMKKHYAKLKNAIKPGDDAKSKKAAAAKTKRIDDAIERDQKRMEKRQDKEVKALAKKQKKQSDNLAQVYKANETKALEKLKAEARALDAVISKRDAIGEQLDEATDKLKSMQDAMSDYSDAVKNSVLDFGGITSLNTAFNANAMAQQLQARIDQVRRFSNVLATLRAQGLNDSLYKQLVDAGVEGGLAYAEAIAEGGPSAIAEFNDLQNTLDSEASSLGNTTSSNLYAAGVQAQQGLVDGLTSQYTALDNEALNLANKMTQSAASLGLTGALGLFLAGSQAGDGFVTGLHSKDGEIEKWAKSTAKAMTKAIKKELGIKSPSRVFKAIGQYTNEGLALGLKDTTYVKRAMSNVSEVMTQAYDPQLSTAIPTASAPGITSGETAVHITVNVPVGANPAQAGREIQQALDAYYAQGGRRTS